MAELYQHAPANVGGATRLARLPLLWAGKLGRFADTKKEKLPPWQGSFSRVLWPVIGAKAQNEMW